MLRYEPIISNVFGTDHDDVYVRPGDPIGFRNMCAPATAALLGADPGIDRMGEYIAVEVFIIPQANMTKELRVAIKGAQKGAQTWTEPLSSAESTSPKKTARS